MKILVELFLTAGVVFGIFLGMRVYEWLCMWRMRK